LIRQLLTETIVLSLVSGVLGISIAGACLKTLTGYIPVSFSPDAQPVLNIRVMTLGFATTLIVGLVVGLVPAWLQSRVELRSILASDGRRGSTALSQRAGQVLIGTEVALAVLSLILAGLMLRSFARLVASDLGFDPNPIITMLVTPLERNSSNQIRYFDQLLSDLRHLPGIGAVGAIDNMPLSGGASFTIFSVDGRNRGVAINRILPGYFQAIGVPLLEGRIPSVDDIGAGRRLLVISRAAALSWFSNASSIGREVSRKAGNEDQLWEVTAVVGDVRSAGALGESVPTVYVPFDASAPSAPRGMAVVVRTSEESPPSAAALRRAAVSVGPQVVVDRIKSGSDLLADQLVRPRQRMILLTLLGCLALLLAVVGVFGVTAYAVARRGREIAVRIALGARSGQVILRIVYDSAWPVATGTMIGLVLAILTTRFVASFLFDTPATDPATFAVVATALVLTGCLAAWLPARRVAAVDPASSLQVE